MAFQVSSLAIIKSFSYNEFIKDDLEFHLRQDFYCLLTVYSIILPKEHSTLYFEHFNHKMYKQIKELQWQLK
jgi:hypothetical protein